MKPIIKILAVAAVVAGTSSVYASFLKKCGSEDQSSTCTNVAVSCPAVPACVTGFSTCNLSSTNYGTIIITCSGGYGVTCNKTFPKCN
jgi:hypothetical protein